MSNLEAANARNQQSEMEEMEERGVVSIYCCCLSFTDCSIRRKFSQTTRPLSFETACC
jgi:hypothetical protein